MLTPCQSGCLRSSRERRGGGARGGSALTGPNLQWQTASMQLWTSRRSQHQNTHTHAHARAHTRLFSVFDQPTQPTRALAASSPDRLLPNTGRLHSLLEPRQSPTDEGCQWGKGSTLKVVTHINQFFFKHFLVVKTFIVVISESKAKFLWEGNTFWIYRKIPWGLDRARQQRDEKWINSVNTHTPFILVVTTIDLIQNHTMNIHIS